jgi:hypothetical protein
MKLEKPTYKMNLKCMLTKFWRFLIRIVKANSGLNKFFGGFLDEMWVKKDNKDSLVYD